MAWCPFAVRQEIPESSQQPRITPTTLIFHQAVSNADSLRDYWNSPGVVLESHFYIGRDGTLYQFVDTGVRADANVDANGFAISVETWDGGNTSDSMGWNPAQLATAKRLAHWVCTTHPVPRRAATTWNGGGIGGHNWFPGPWADGPRGCPGAARNTQIRNDIVPFVIGGGIEEDPLSALTADEQRELLDGLRDLRRDLSVRYVNSGRTDSTGYVLDRHGAMFPMLDNAGITKAGGIAPGTLTNAVASTYRATFEQILPRLTAMAAVLAQLAEDDSTPVTLTPEQLAELRTDTADVLRAEMDQLQARVDEQVQRGVAELGEAIASRFGLTRDDVEAELREFFSRASTAA